MEPEISDAKPPTRVAFVFTHRIQYFINVLDELQRRGRLSVFAIYENETASMLDPGFGRKIAWDNRSNSTFEETVLKPHGSSEPLSLDSALGEIDPEIVHINGYAKSISWAGCRWARRRHLTYFLRGDGDTIGAPRPIRAAVRRFILRPVVAGASIVFYQGDENRKFWRRNGAREDRLKWIPCVADSQQFGAEAFSTSAERAEFRRRLGAEDSAVVFVVSGKLEQRKRPMDVIEAFARARSACPREIRLWFVGSGALEKHLKDRASALGVSSRINFLGFRNQTELPAVMQAADVMVHASAADPWPYSVLEGAMSGLALILSDRVGSVPEWSAMPAGALVYRCSDVEELSRHMAELAQSDRKRSELSRNVRARAGRYTETAFAEAFEAAVGITLNGTA